MSTGIASKEDIKLAIQTCKNVGNNDIAILKCTSAYPAPLEEINLKTMQDMEKESGVIVGLSDHSLVNDISIAAVAMGAKIIEKHFILDRTIGGPDSEFSMEPKEFKEMVQSIRNVEKALGKVTYELSDKIIANREFKRSLFAVKDIKKGEIVTEENVRSIRPGFGLHPKYLKEILNKKALCDIEKGTPLKFDFF